MSGDPSPAQRYASAARRSRILGGPLGPMIEGLEVELDDFQWAAAQALTEERNVLVAAPTGAGKTLVAEFAVELARVQGAKLFYTTPIKALSNQKYHDLVRLHGEHEVGLLTGDVSVNGEAPVVVMTTEVLRNMIYGGSTTLDDLGWVVMDEVHYLADRFRGPVWEEVILHLPPEVRLVALSATVSNAEEFGAWLDEVRGDTATIVSEHRPVPLTQHLLVRDRIHDLHRAPFAGGAINPALRGIIRAAGDDTRRERGGGEHRGRRGAGSRGRPGAGASGGGPGRIRRAPRPVIVAELDRNGMLPAIVFIFSRAGCDAAVDQLRRTGMRLNDPEETAAVDRLIDERCAHLPGHDLAAVGFDRWRESASRGFAAHHAGMLPVFKQIVEELFEAGLIKVVFATETLALGVNMPARSVLLEQTDKWDGSAHTPLTPGEYTQLTGRAGRRGIDTEGHAVVVYTGDMTPEQIAALAANRTFPLRSRFHPTYNMAVNLLARMPVERVRDVMARSFAQFQADRSSVGLARQVRTLDQQIAEAGTAMTCDRGDITEYGELRARLSTLQKESRRERGRARTAADESLLGSLRRGEVVAYRVGRRQVHAVVLEVDGARWDGTRVEVLTDEPRVRVLRADDGLGGLVRAGRLSVPKDFHVRSAGRRKDLAASLRAGLAEGRLRPEPSPPSPEDSTAQVVSDLRAELAAHPCHDCPDREEHLRHEHRWRGRRAERDRAVERIESRTSWLPRDLDLVCALLVEMGYLERAGEQYRVTRTGHWLATVYTERDLVLTECLSHGVWDGLDAPALAAVVALLVHTPRRESAPALPAMPAPVGAALEATTRLASRVAQAERRHRLDRTTAVDPGLVGVIWVWATGGTLREAMTAGDMTAGDVVRSTKQVIDVLDQLQDGPVEALADTAREAIGRLRRGVVAWSGVG